MGFHCSAAVAITDTAVVDCNIEQIQGSSICGTGAPRCPDQGQGPFVLGTVQIHSMRQSQPCVGSLPWVNFALGKYWLRRGSGRRAQRNMLLCIEAQTAKSKTSTQKNVHFVTFQSDRNNATPFRSYLYFSELLRFLSEFYQATAIMK